MGNFSVEERATLRNSELLRELSDKNFNTFINLSHRTTYQAGENLLEEGKRSDYLYILLSGTVALYKMSGMKQQLLDRLSKGQSIGEMRVIKNQPCSLTVTTSSPVVVLCILLSKLRELEYNQCYESILDGIINILTYRLSHTNRLAASGVSHKKKLLNHILLMTGGIVVFLCGLAVGYFI